MGRASTGWPAGWRSLVLVALSATAGCGGGNDAGAGQLRSFTTSLTFTRSSATIDPEIALPASDHITVTVDRRTPGADRLIVGCLGALADVPITIGAGGHVTYRNQDPTLLDQQRTTLRIPLPPRADGNTCSQPLNVSFVALDLDLDGATLTGQGNGFLQYQDGDALGTLPFTAQAQGVVDTVGPSLAELLPAAMIVHPFDGFAIPFSEALPSDVQLDVVDETGASFPLVGQPATLPSLFSLGPRVLPFARRWHLTSTTLRDLVGNRTDAPPLQIVTPGAPGLFAGFSEATEALLSGSARIVDATTIPALATSHALYLGPRLEGGEDAATSGRFTARLPIPPDATDVVITGRVLLAEGRGVPLVRARTGVSGHAVNEAQVELFRQADLDQPSGTMTLPRLGPAHELAIPLPAGASGELLIDLLLDTGGCGATLPPGGTLIDAITVR